MADPFFTEVTGPIRFEGLDSTEPLAFKVYDRDRLVLGTRMEDHLRPGVCFWHSFAWPGTDMFGVGTLDRPWLDGTGDDRWTPRGGGWRWPSSSSTKLGTPYYCFHDRDVAPEGAQLRRVPLEPRRARRRCRRLPGADRRPAPVGHREPVHPSALSGPAPPRTPIPEVFAYAAAQVKHMLEVTHRLGGQNYVLWGGREGYDTLLNTDLRREGAQLARFLHLVAEHKHRIGFTGQLLIEPKPMEPTKHQYDYDVATVHGFLVRNGLDGEYRVNIEANHATLAGHSFHHEVAYAVGQRDVRQHRRQPRRPAERLGHRPVPELGRGPRPADLRDPARGRLRHRRVQLRRQAAPPEHRPQRPVPRPHRRPGHARSSAARGGRSGRARSTRRAA